MPNCITPGCKFSQRYMFRKENVLSQSQFIVNSHEIKQIYLMKHCITLNSKTFRHIKIHRIVFTDYKLLAMIFAQLHKWDKHLCYITSSLKCRVNAHILILKPIHNFIDYNISMANKTKSASFVKQNDNDLRYQLLQIQVSKTKKIGCW